MMKVKESRSTPAVTQTHRRHSSSVNKQVKEVGRRNSEKQAFRIKNYVISKKTIGAGSMGKVKLAECTTDIQKQQYAVKIMPKIDLDNIVQGKPRDPKDSPKEREQRTIREMTIMSLLKHPNICQLKEYLSDKDRYYMFLEYVDGGQLLDYIIKHGRLREKQARKFTRQIVSALDYCHRNSIVHRDLKIENILITQSEQIKIIDFGLSNIYSPTQQLNTFCGSLYFAAPELLKARPYTGPEVDVWSLGVVLFVLVCGRVPFDDTNLPALHEKIKSGVIEDYPDYLSKDCLDLLSKIFVVDPAQRITLSGIQSHSWINKGYEEPIKNHLPHRQPIEYVDMDVVNGMQGFGLGTPEEIYDKLQRIVSSNSYQFAAIRIDENYTKKMADDEALAARPKWRRSLSARRKSQILDDFRSLPGMYEPLISIYYLVKERQEANERIKHLINSQSTPITITRTTSTSTPSSHSAPNNDSQQLNPLSRSRTLNTSKNLPDLPQQASDSRAPKPTASKSERVSTTSLIRQKSIQAVKRLGLKLPNLHHDLSSPITIEKKVSPDQSPLSSSISSSNGKSKKSNWLKLELTGGSFEKSLKESSASTKQTNRHSFISTSSSTSRPSWRKLSISRKGVRNSTDLSSGNLAALNDPMLIPTKMPTHDPFLAPRNSFADPFSPRMTKSKSDYTSSRVPVVEKSKSTSQPKSLFNFNRNHLYRITPEQMILNLNYSLNKMNVHIEEYSPNNYTFYCQCSSHVWSKYVVEDSSAKDINEEIRKRRSIHGDFYDDSIKFSIMIYEARWASRRIGIKVKEAGDEEIIHTKSSYRQFYHCLLNELDNLI
ncbi:kinase-like domain-containing protein [Pilobolus umbonatus]|nr:kinase-like domain-containing protein [Pilobolus umbonatus]